MTRLKLWTSTVKLVIAEARLFVPVILLRLLLQQQPRLPSRSRMHSATVRHCRLCSVRNTTQRNPQHEYYSGRSRVHRTAPHITFASSYVDQVDQNLHSSASQGSLSGVIAGDASHTERSSKRCKLDESLPYVAVLKARKEHRHRVQEKQRALGKRLVSCTKFDLTSVGRSHKTTRTVVQRNI